MKDWYLAKSSQDRMVILIVGALVLLTLAYLLIIRPLSAGLERRAQNVAIGEENLAFMRDGQARVRASGGGATDDSLSSDKAPYLLVDDIIRKAGIKLPERVEPIKQGTGARVQFSEVEFDKLVGVIAELERYGLNVSTFNVTRKGTGLVSARINLERG